MTEQSPIKSQIATSLQNLSALRDEIRLQLHLAGMDAKQNWEQILEPQVEEASKLAEEATAISQKAIEDILARVKSFRDQHTPKR
ncbi:hypothetical protein BH09MYX1_BH09MYX1_29720 [soil metagenome]